MGRSFARRRPTALVLVATLAGSLLLPHLALADQPPEANPIADPADRAELSNARPTTAVVRTTSDGVVTTQLRSLTFWDPSQVFVFAVQLGDGTRLAIHTRDCCAEGDKWGLTLINPRSGDDTVVSNCGLGSTTGFRGGVAAEPVANWTLIAHVYYCSGVDDFPALMTVRFRYDGNIIVEPRGGG